ncbi:MAG: DUF1015 domain-containing protein [Chloroflexi bacterium]|nr:DUF1015 domain-containing protein [Chloroflexota bacterium]
MKLYPSIGLQASDVLLPKKGIDMSKWAVVACDQFTAEPEYWANVEKGTQNIPSTYHMILPEAYLGSEKAQTHQVKVNPAMDRYLLEGIFQEVEGFIYVEREIESGIRQGLIAALDLEHYDFGVDSHSLIRATEGTIVDRLPPRIAIRKGAPLELPHILVLIDDPGFSVIQPLSENKGKLSKLYDFELMAGGGHLRGFHVEDDNLEHQIVNALAKLASKNWQKDRYGAEEPPLLYAVGDGNHSLATAKSIWETIKKDVDHNHPARFALVELVNIHDPAIIFEPIHRVLMNVDFNLRSEMEMFFDGELEIEHLSDYPSLRTRVESIEGNGQVFGWLNGSINAAVKITKPPHTLVVGSLQKFLDMLKGKYPSIEIDYIHGDEAITELSAKPRNSGFVLPAMDKYKLFESVIKDGPLPRKTFSMGEANEKRYYLEARKIK